MSRSRLEALEAAGYEPRSGELLVALVWLVLGELPIADDELNASRRRAMFILAAGGDPHRDLDLNTVAAERLAGELEEGVVVCVLADAGWKYLSASFWDDGQIDESKLWW